MGWIKKAGNAGVGIKLTGMAAIALVVVLGALAAIIANSARHAPR